MAELWLALIMNQEESLCWYHASLSREDAEQLLKEGEFRSQSIFGSNHLSSSLIPDGREGVYLVRDSGSSAGDYVLSVFYKVR